MTDGSVNPNDVASGDLTRPGTIIWEEPNGTSYLITLENPQNARITEMIKSWEQEPPEISDDKPIRDLIIRYHDRIVHHKQPKGDTGGSAVS